MTFSTNKTSINFNSIVIHNCSDGKICNQHNCKSIKEVTIIRYLGIICDKSFKVEFVHS